MAVPIPQAFYGWVQQQSIIQHAAPSNGGWERWAQIDFSAYLVSQGVVTVVEDHCFTDQRLRNDLTILGANGAPGSCIEFKVYNHFSESIGDYRDKLQEDQLKLENNALTAFNAQNVKFSIGLGLQAKIIEFLQLTYRVVINAANLNHYLVLFFGDAYSHQQVQSAQGVGFVVSFLRVDYK